MTHARKALAFLVVIGALAQRAICAPVELDVRQIDRDRVIRAADAALRLPPVTITAFRAARSTGGVHDFFSQGDYWWPNPQDPAGPYIQRDGMTNPDNFVEHRRVMFAMSIEVPALTAAYRLTGDARYARHAANHLRAWFVDDGTRMNPNLQYAQAIKGVSTGRRIGIIDTIHLIEVARSVTILEQASQLDPKDRDAIKKWFADYLEWMTSSKNGKDEFKAVNNHGTCWVMQAAAFAALVGDEPKLADYRTRFKEVLLPNQLAPDGSFPQELRRTKPFSYSLFNLDAMATICRILSTPQDNLWNFKTPDGRSMRTAMEFMYPYIQDKSEWPHKPDVMFWEFWPVRSPALLFAGEAYGEQKYINLWKTLEANPTNEEVLRNLPVRQPVLWEE